MPSSAAYNRQYYKANQKRLTTVHSAWNKKRRTERRDKLVEAQKGRCAICGTDNPQSKTWCTDHNHKTGKIRGALCRCCNLGLGYFRDSSKLLDRAARYLYRHNRRKAT